MQKIYCDIFEKNGDPQIHTRIFSCGDYSKNDFSVKITERFYQDSYKCCDHYRNYVAATFFGKKFRVGGSPKLTGSTYIDDNTPNKLIPALHDGFSDYDYLNLPLLIATLREITAREQNRHPVGGDYWQRLGKKLIALERVESEIINSKIN